MIITFFQIVAIFVIPYFIIRFKDLAVFKQSTDLV